LTALRWLVRDITEQKEAEQKIRALNAQLERQISERTAQLESAEREVLRLKKQAEPTSPLRKNSSRRCSACAARA
jgi:hypothetical protein